MPRLLAIRFTDSQPVFSTGARFNVTVSGLERLLVSDPLS
jgi:hypothetical protein